MNSWITLNSKFKMNKKTDNNYLTNLNNYINKKYKKIQ